MRFKVTALIFILVNTAWPVLSDGVSLKIENSLLSPALQINAPEFKQAVLGVSRSQRRELVVIKKSYRNNPYLNKIVLDIGKPFSALFNRLVSFGVEGKYIIPVKEGKDKGYYLIDTVNLEVKDENDSKRFWVMHELRDVEEEFSFRPFSQLADNPLKLTAPLFARVQSSPLNGDKISFGNNHNGVYLGFVEGAAHPVIIKKIRPQIPLTQVKREIYLAQLLSIIGVGPKFYGMLRTWDGCYAYAMQAASGRLTTASSDKLKNNVLAEIEQRLRKWGISDGYIQKLVSSDGRVVVIDAGDISMPEVDLSGLPDENLRGILQGLHAQVLNLEKIEAAI